MNQIILQRATPRTGQSEALSDCIVEELRHYGEHLCDVCGLAAVAAGAIGVVLRGVFCNRSSRDAL